MDEIAKPEAKLSSYYGLLIQKKTERRVKE